MFLKPRTIRNEEKLGSIDVALRRINVFEGPSEYMIAYIKDGDAIVASADSEHQTTFVDRYIVGHAIDCAIEFDGYWLEAENNKYSLVTIGEPYIFTVNSSGVLILQIGKDGAPLILCSSDVAKVTAIRGWKSTQDSDIDQGLICAYVKTNGRAYYRSYSRQSDGSCLWEDEHIITELTSSIQNLKLFRTNDYRTGFLIESNRKISWILTKRAWSGLSIGNEYLKAKVLSATIKLTEISYKDISIKDEYLCASPSIAIGIRYASSFYSIEDISNSSDKVINIMTNEPMYSIDVIDFSLTDEDGTRFSVASIVQDVNDGRKLSMTMYSSLDYANQTGLGNGTLSLSFDAVGLTRGETGQSINSFSTILNPIGLNFIQMEKPKPSKAYNVLI